MVLCEIPLDSNAWLHRLQISIRIFVSLLSSWPSTLWAYRDRWVSTYQPGASFLFQLRIRLQHIEADLRANRHRQETFPALFFLVICSTCKRRYAYVSRDPVRGQVLRQFALGWCRFAVAFVHCWHLYCGQEGRRVSLHSWLSSIVRLAFHSAFWRRWRAFLLVSGRVLRPHALLRRLLLLIVRAFWVAAGARCFF